MVTGDRLTVGVVTPHAAAGPEVELPAMTQGRVTTVVSRTGSPPEASPAPSRTATPAYAELITSTEPAALDRATATFRGRTLAAVAHTSTTSGYVIGHRREAALVERLSQRFDVPAFASCASAAAALRTHGVGRVQLVHPPWLDDEFDDLGVAYFRSHEVDAVVTKDSRNNNLGLWVRAVYRSAMSVMAEVAESVARKYALVATASR